MATDEGPSAPSMEVLGGWGLGETEKGSLSLSAGPLVPFLGMLVEGGAAVSQS